MVQEQALVRIKYLEEEVEKSRYLFLLQSDALLSYCYQLLCYNMVGGFALLYFLCLL